MALKCAPEVKLWEVGLVALCDLRGRNPKSAEPLPIDSEAEMVMSSFLKKIKEAEVESKPEEAVLQGRDLLDLVEPGAQLGKMLRVAYDIQLEEGIRDKEALRERIIEQFHLEK